MTGAEAFHQKHRLFELQKGECFACESLCRFEDMERHHVQLRCLGGPDDDWNIVLICGQCHDVAHDPTMRPTRDKKRHLVLHAIFIKKGYQPEERKRLYAQYARFGSGLKSQSNLFRSSRMRILPVEYDRWRDDGGR